MEEVDKAVEAGMHAFPVWGRALHMRTSNLGVHMSRWVSGVKGVHRWRDMTGTKLRERERGGEREREGEMEREWERGREG